MNQPYQFEPGGIADRNLLLIRFVSLACFRKNAN